MTMFMLVLRRLWGLWPSRRSPGDSAVLVPKACPFLVAPQAAPVTTPQATPVSPAPTLATGDRGPSTGRRVWLPAAALGVCYASAAGLLALVVLVVLNLRRDREPVGVTQE